MRRATIALLMLTALGACRQEQDFDARYQQAQTRLEGKARAIDQEIAVAASDAAAANVPPPAAGNNQRSGDNQGR